MNAISVYYSTKHMNLGDAANPFLLKKLFQTDLILSNYKKAVIYPVGSILGKLTTPFWNLPKLTSGVFREKAVIWTSGFLMLPEAGSILYRKLRVTALRGKKTQAILEKLTGRKYNVPLGDGGLLMPLLLDKMPEKKYSLGIIPHYEEFACHSPTIQKLVEKFPEAKVISPEGMPGEMPEDAVKRILMEIASCEMILSSSLHGIIAADAFGIPNRHFLNKHLTGGQFKFEDYRSAFDCEENPVPIQDILSGSVSISAIMKKNQIPRDKILRTAELLKRTNPFCC